MTADEFCLRLLRDCAVPRGGHVLVAVSGGADSTALLCFFCEVRDMYPLTLSCAHVEHGIRGEASWRDMEFVRDLCGRLGVPFYGAHVDAPGHARGCGLEDAARTLRYDSLQKTAKKIGADCIALAHHRGDQAETVLLHAARGSDLRGLCAMRMRRGNLIRPLLMQTSEELRAYLASIGQPWREDESNRCEEYARNRIRLRVMPELERTCPGAQAALARLARAAQRDEDYFERQIEALPLRVIPLVNGAALERAQLQELHEALLGRVLVKLAKEAGMPAPEAAQVDSLVRLLNDGEACVNLNGGGRARIGRHYLCMTWEDAPVQDTPLAQEGITDTPFGVFHVRDAQEGETGDGLGSQAIPLRLLENARVTSRLNGDAFVPFGKNRPVKLKKLMIDAGIERAMRKSMPVLRGPSGILWAVGLRPAEACRADAGEKSKLIEFQGSWPRCTSGGRDDNQEEIYHGRKKGDLCGSEG